MFKTTRMALAVAGALIVSGCATSAWQPIPGHPADPAAQAGAATPITSLVRYRKETAPAPSAPAQQEMDRSQHQMEHREKEQ